MPAMTKLIPLLAVLSLVLPSPRLALVVAAAASAGTYFAVRWLLANRTVFVFGRWSHA